jgi:DNA helicase-2/ATP-dependent DNA helicase PcrA
MDETLPPALAESLDSLNLGQRRAVTFEGRHLLVLAGAGTGKTRTIVARAAYLIAQGANPAKIQIVTFTKRAAAEIVSRVRSCLPQNQARALKGSTFHSWCNQMLTTSPNLFGVKDFSVIDEDDQHAIMKMACGGKSLAYEGVRVKPLELLEYYSFARNTKRNLSEMIQIKIFGGEDGADTKRKIEAFRNLMKPIYETYEQKKRERRYLDYDDMLQVVAARLKADEKAREIIAENYEHILVDEMQDTNPLQWDLLEPFQDCCRLFCVGDDAQSIYSFRGADFRNIHSFAERVPGAEVYKLEDNYRSTQEILDAANWLLRKSPLDYGKTLRAVRGAGVKPEIVNVRSDWDEAAWIADKIAENYSQGNKEYKDHLILVRSQVHSHALQAVLIQRRIPYVTYGGYKFMEAAHIKDLVSALRVVNNQQDEIAWIRFLTLWKGVGEARAAKWLTELLGQPSIGASAELLASRAFNEDSALIPQVLSIIDKNRGDVRRSVAGAFGLMEKRLAEKYREDWDKKRKADFPVLEALAGRYATLGEFITECLLDTSASVNNSPILGETDVRKTGSQDCVVISTIHSAKGLEADVCFVITVSPKAYPASWAVENIDQVEEERRVLYVAMTRAKNELFITRNLHSVHAIDRFARQKVVAGKSIEEHYFLNGLPDALVTQETAENTGGFGRDLDAPNPINVNYGMDFS